MVHLLRFQHIQVVYLLLLAPSNLKLAQRHYQARMLELKDLLLVEETKFKLVPFYLFSDTFPHVSLKADSFRD
jgi:hypothetical protein